MDKKTKKAGGVPKKPLVETMTAEQYREIETAVQNEASRRPDKKGEIWRIKKLSRYWCFRFQNEAKGGCIADDPTREEKFRPPPGFKEQIENTVGFTSWQGFADLWDLHPAKPTVIIHRTVSIWHEHDARMAAITPILPVINQSDSRGEKLVKRTALQMMSTQKKN